MKIFLLFLPLATFAYGQEAIKTFHCRAHLINGNGKILATITQDVSEKGLADAPFQESTLKKCIDLVQADCLKGSNQELFFKNEPGPLSCVDDAYLTKNISLKIPQATHGEVNKLVEAAAMLLTAPIGLPLELLDVLDDLFTYGGNTLTFCGLKSCEVVSEVAYNVGKNVGKGVGFFFEGLGQWIWHVISPKHPEVKLDYDFDWETFHFAGEFFEYWHKAQASSGNSVNTWMAEHAYKLVGAEIPPANVRWGFLRVLTCQFVEGRSFDFSVVTFNMISVTCHDAAGERYQLSGAGLSAELFYTIRDKLYLTILDLNPLGDLEGVYLMGGVSAGLVDHGTLLQVGFSELGFKWILAASKAYEKPSFLFGGVETRALYIKKLD